MSPAEKQKVLRDAQAYLNSQMYKAASDVGYEHMTTPNPRYSTSLTWLGNQKKRCNTTMQESMGEVMVISNV